MAEQKQKMHLPKLDDLFTTEEERIKNNSELITEIDLSEIDNFPDHPFKVIDNEELFQMSESIKDKGVIVPALVRPKEDGRYEMISGHRRKRASELAGLEKIPCIVRELSDDEAIIAMVDSNMQREEILPSERAFAYKMKLEALNHQGKRNDLTSCQVGTKLSTDVLSNEMGDSERQIYRYIRLTYLIPELLEKVDNKEIAFNPGVELSYLKEEEQYALLDCIEYNDCTPSHAQTIIMKRLSQEGKLDTDKIDEILSQEKPNQIPKMRFNESRIRSVLPKNIDNDQIENFVVKAIEFYSHHLRNRDMER